MSRSTQLTPPFPSRLLCHRPGRVGHLGMLMLASVLLAGLSVRGEYIWKNDFESVAAGPVETPEAFAALTMNRSSHGPAGTSTIYEIVRGPEHPVRNGRHALRMQLTHVDATSYRTEVTLKGARFEYGNEYWVGFSEFLKNWEYNELGELVAQAHLAVHPGTGDHRVHGTGPNLYSVLVERGRQKVYINTFPSADFVPKSNAAIGGKMAWEGDVPGNVWVDWVFHFKASPKGDGFIRVWRNGREIVRERGLINAQSRWAICGEPIVDAEPRSEADRTYYYPKLGVYMWALRHGPKQVRSREMYIDDVKVWRGPGEYDFVAPGRGTDSGAPRGAVPSAR